MRKNLLFYFVVLAVFGLGIYLTLGFGSRLRPGAAAAQASPPASAAHEMATAADARDSPAASNVPPPVNRRNPLAVLLLQVIVVVVAARVCGALSVKAGQPAVIGEIVAGMVLGPSLLGMLSPAAQAFLFPASSLGFLSMLSQLGVILFMFVVGMDLNVKHLRQKADAAVLVSHASIVVPFFLGVAFSLLVYTSVAPPHISFASFALFLGVAMSVTAFPVLARIVEERGLKDTHLGATAIACAAVDDVTAWCVLAAVAAVVTAGGLVSALPTILLTLLFIGVMLFVVKPRAERLGAFKSLDDARGKGPVAWALAFMFASALLTEVIGIHALFGAFLAGVVLPSRGRLRGLLRERLETFSSVFLLPLFFAFTGLRTQVGLLDDLQGWLMCAGVIAVAVAGKLGGSTFAARWTGMSWRESFSVGALMNTRGLVELIVLNFGYDLGILPPRVFAMMVLMALVTTLMTGPLLSLAESAGRREAGVEGEAAAHAA
ncbi:MAG TPA: cation:proton antiporter [Pyrinomonadaceae bacterium]|jgi:Kef-type K+ transport system membrane component KefB|nr:cation:proton antiporter [Pyrinomonadaceae bacterium]